MTDSPRRTPPPVPDLGEPAGLELSGGGSLRFVDATDELGATHVFASAIEVPLEKDTAIMMGGVSAADLDADGDTDLFVLGGGHEADALFLNDGTGRFTDVAADVGLGEHHLGAGSTVGDYDADGDLDLYVTSHGDLDVGAVPGANRLYRNELVPTGTLSFTEVAAEAGVATTSARVHDGFGSVFGDIDLDGDLDLVVAGWQRDGFGSRIFRNDGDGTFTDVTEAAGLIDDGIRGFAPCLVDMNGDRLPELLLVSDFGTTRYLENDGSVADELRFVDVTQQAGAGLEWSGMGTAVGDVDLDGRFDWYVTAIFDADSVGRGDGNKLYLNRYSDGGSDSGTPLLEVAQDAGVADGAWGWGSRFVDVDHDGHLDLFEVNGWDLPSYVGNLSRMWLSTRADTQEVTFTDVTLEAGPLHNRHGLGVAELDLDGDGDRDLAVTASNDEFRLYRNDLRTDDHWLIVQLDTTGFDHLAPHGVGAVIRVTDGDVTHSRVIGACSNFNSSSELSAHVGLGASDVVQVTVEWPDGSTTVVDDVRADQRLTIHPDR